MMNDHKAQKNTLSYVSAPLAQVLQLLKLDVEIYHNAKVCGSWLMDDFHEHNTTFHIVTEGECTLDVPGHFLGQLEKGDMAIFPRELPHKLIAPHTLQGQQRHIPLAEATGIKGTGLLCGDVYFKHQGSHYLLNSLPPMLIIKAEQASQWIQPLMQLITQESLHPCPASEAIFSRLTELLFSYAIRHHLFDKKEQANMLSLYTNTRLAAAISAIHQHPQQHWTIEQLAQKCNMSRTIFAEKFRTVSGWTVAQYLTWWRMQLAWQYLQEGQSISQTITLIGYQSEAAFSRTFKKIFSTTPGKVRKK